MSTREAMKLAQEAELDLVKIAPGAKPPVCKIIDYGKYRYELIRKEKEAKKKQKTVEIKEIRLSPNIETNDLNTKINAAKKFISKGNKVKITLRFRGREMAHMLVALSYFPAHNVVTLSYFPACVKLLFEFLLSKSYSFQTESSLALCPHGKP